MNQSLRIVSLVPSLTETVCDWGLRPQLLGCTTFCVSPKGLHRSCQIIGGTKDPNLELIRSIQPTHILANQEENTKEAVQALANEYPTLITFPRSPREVPHMLRDLGKFLGIAGEAEASASKLEQQLKAGSLAKPKRFLYLIWQNPYMAAGPDTYISRTLEHIGWIPAYQGAERYPVLDIKAMQACQTDLILLSSEPYPFRRRDASSLRQQWPEAPAVLKIDGQMLSWFGTRTAAALAFLQADDSHWLQNLEQPHEALPPR